MPANKKAPKTPSLDMVAISVQTAQVALQSMNKLAGGDGRTKVIIGKAEMELEKVLGTAPENPNGKVDEVSEVLEGQ